jgi:single-strand DNA-binding protein
MNLNTVVLIGRLVRIPEMRHVGNNTVVQIALAISQGKNGTTETADLIPVSVWGSARSLADLVSQLDKGALMAVQGSLRPRSWEGSTALEVVAEDVQLVPTATRPAVT